MEKVCSVCGRKIKTRNSRKRGIGPTCEKKYIAELNKGQLQIENFKKAKKKKEIRGYKKIC